MRGHDCLSACVLNETSTLNLLVIWLAKVVSVEAYYVFCIYVLYKTVMVRAAHIRVKCSI